MKKLFALIVLLLSLSASNRLRAQSLAYEIVATHPSEYTPSAFTYFQGGNGEVPTMLKVGTILSASGVIVGIVGGVTLLNQINSTSQNVATVIGSDFLFVAGGGIGITGGCLSIAGLVKQHEHRYSLQLVAPKSNQVGIAYNF